MDSESHRRIHSSRKSKDSYSPLKRFCYEKTKQKKKQGEEGRKKERKDPSNKDNSEETDDGWWWVSWRRVSSVQCRRDSRLTGFINRMQGYDPWHCITTTTNLLLRAPCLLSQPVRKDNIRHFTFHHYYSTYCLNNGWQQAEIVVGEVGRKEVVVDLAGGFWRVNASRYALCVFHSLSDWHDNRRTPHLTGIMVHPIERIPFFFLARKDARESSRGERREERRREGKKPNDNSKDSTLHFSSSRLDECHFLCKSVEWSEV